MSQEQQKSVPEVGKEETTAPVSEEPAAVEPEVRSDAEETKEATNQEAVTGSKEETVEEEKPTTAVVPDAEATDVVVGGEVKPSDTNGDTADANAANVEQTETNEATPVVTETNGKHADEVEASTESVEEPEVETNGVCKRKADNVTDGDNEPTAENSPKKVKTVPDADQAPVAEEAAA